tara:strand:- start:4531 stop:5919 length:1389 start_codon:yes stop_codon:yes gene_type:complete
MNSKELLTLEDNTKILDYRFNDNNIPMYLMIRHYLLQTFVNNEFSLTDYSPKQKIKLVDIIPFLFNTLTKNLYRSPKKDIYIFSPDVQYKKVNSHYVNKLYDFFIDSYPDQTQIVVKSFVYKKQSPKNRVVYFDFIIKLVSSLCGKFTSIKKKDKETIRQFLIFLKEYSPYKIEEETLSVIEKTLKSNAKQLKYYQYLNHQFLKLKKPKLILVEDAHYLNEPISIIMAAKKLNIKVGEIQHGYIGPSHRAYNFSEKLQPLIKEYLPDYFLSFGKFWNDSINIPAKKIPIGNPELLKNKTLYKNKNQQKKQILFISGGTVFNKLIELISGAYNELNCDGYKIILRPHPLERSEIENRYSLLIKMGVQIDQGNLFDSLSSSEIIVSMEVTTVLYESICFTNKIYLEDSKYSSFYEQNHVFIKFINSNDLVESIKSKAEVDLNLDDFWDSNYTNNYKNFIESIMA